jgi:1-acyl-sn-glycerol-3-phosphate acyltransferase
MYYRHNLNYEYPSRPDEHMLKVNSKRKVTLDENYPYLQKGWWWKLRRVVFWVLVTVIVFPLMRLTHGLKIYGKENYKNHKKAFKNGAITISNHVFMWDYLCVLKAVRPHLSYFPAWKGNLEGSNAGLVRLAGGIPIPTDNRRAMIKFKQAMDEVVESGKWMHFFPEGSLWFFYPDIRPLKKAVFKYAVRYDKPIIPISMSFRPRKGLLKLFSRKPSVDLHIGEALYPDKDLPRGEAEEKLRKEAYHIMQVMNGIHPGDETYNVDQNPDNYQKTM